MAMFPRPHPTPLLLLLLFSCLHGLGGWAATPDSALQHSAAGTARDGWVTIAPPEFRGAINNPLKGFRDYKPGAYGLLKRQYIRWNDIESDASDGVDRIIAHINRITEIRGKRFEDLNVKLVPRVFLDWDGTAGTPQSPKQHWPLDLHTFDYDSPAFQERLKRLVAKLGEAWDNDPRIFAVQMGLIGHFGEHHNPAPTTAQRRLLADAFQKAFRNKPVLVRHTDPEFVQAGFGIYYDTFANISREPPDGPRDQFPWQATHVHQTLWLRAPIEGEVEYNWQRDRENARWAETFGRTPDETMTVPAYRRYMIDKIRRYHASYLGWIDTYNASNPDVVAGAAEIQETFGYRFVLEQVRYPSVVQPGHPLPVQITVRNTGSAPFYLDWPVAVGLLDPATREVAWSAPLAGVDLRRWLPGEDWDSDRFDYRKPAKSHLEEGRAEVPSSLDRKTYILGLAILDRQGGMLPSARFATTNYFRGGWHPIGFIGIGMEPKETGLQNIPFDSPAFDDSLHYKVPPVLRAVQAAPSRKANPVQQWTPTSKHQLINPWRYWTLESTSPSLEKVILHEGGRILRVTGGFGRGSSLSHTLGSGIRLDPGRYRFTSRVRGTPGQTVVFELADGWRRVSREAEVSLSAEWQEQSITFEIKAGFKHQTTLRFALPNDASGTFDLSNPQLESLD